ncbi:hypothetical protein EniyanLRS_143 [Mycobacterium phage EniyanLRS]|uniref:Uncharacterized protein n=2 Tax=Mycobacterium virus Wildcat TaxID=1993859 RepID=A0A0B5A021_9CAUD|nr:hypothetical protein COSMO_151 [Mycobacterium phage Cosmo]AQT25792.1 hypothetical protein EniyanLRS_143 [Mycobacterium phage EniyanLRS]WKR36132.1 hypothetical protein [Mycobacterium phage Azrael100]
MYEVWITGQDGKPAFISTGLSRTQADAIVNNLKVEGIDAWKEEQ